MKSLGGVFFVLIILLSILYIAKFRPEILHGNFSNLFAKQPHANITINGKTFDVLLAKTQSEQERGLGYRNNLPENEGMLFLFDRPDYQKFWMKGMRFPLDIIYIRDTKIITIYQNLPNPDSQTKTLQIYSAPEPVDKVLEINEGLSQKYKFKEGEVVKISL